MERGSQAGHSAPRLDRVDRTLRAIAAPAKSRTSATLARPRVEPVMGPPCTTAHGDVELVTPAALLSTRTSCGPRRANLSISSPDNAIMVDYSRSRRDEIFEANWDGGRAAADRRMMGLHPSSNPEPRTGSPTACSISPTVLAVDDKVPLVRPAPRYADRVEARIAVALFTNYYLGSTRVSACLFFEFPAVSCALNSLFPQASRGSKTHDDFHLDQQARRQFASQVTAVARQSAMETRPRRSARRRRRGPSPRRRRRGGVSRARGGVSRARRAAPRAPSSRRTRSRIPGPASTVQSFRIPDSGSSRSTVAGHLLAIYAPLTKRSAWSIRPRESARPSIPLRRKSRGAAIGPEASQDSSLDRGASAEEAARTWRRRGSR